MNTSVVQKNEETSEFKEFIKYKYFKSDEISESLIKNITEQIVKLAQPISIYLFGSVARGENKKQSDLDFLILVSENIHKRKMAQLLYRDVDSQLIPCDFVVTTKSILDKNKDNFFKVYSNALKDGVLLYGK